jgi:hypothetical protein
MSTARDKWKCADRELQLRHRVYPRWVEQGRMTMAVARRELDLMAEIAADYRQLAEAEEKEGTLL